MATGTIEGRVRGVVAKVLRIDQGSINLLTRFEDGLDHIEIIIGLEEEFLITIFEKEEKKIKTVQEAMDFISSQLHAESQLDSRRLM